MTIPDSAEKQKESRASERTTRLVEKKRKAELQDKLIQRAIFLSDTDLNNVYEYVDGVSSPRNNIEDYELEGEYGRRQINLRLRLVTVSAALNQFSLPAVAGRDGLIYGMTIRARVQREDDVDDAIAWKGPVQHQGISLPYDLALKLAHNFVQFRMWVRERAGMINAARKAAYEHISNLKADKKHLHLLEHIKDLQRHATKDTMPLPLTTSAGSHPLGADEERPTKRQKPNQPSNPMELAIQALKDAANAEVAKEWEIFAKEKAQHEDVMKAALELVGLLETTYIEWSSETLSETLGGIVEAMKRKRKK